MTAHVHAETTVRPECCPRCGETRKLERSRYGDRVCHGCTTKIAREKFDEAFSKGLRPLPAAAQGLPREDEYNPWELLAACRRLAGTAQKSTGDMVLLDRIDAALKREGRKQG